MAPKGKASAKAEEPPPEAVEEEEEPPAEEELVVTAPYPGTIPLRHSPVHELKNPQLFPARAVGRPHMRQVLSEPDLRREFFGLPDGQSQVHADPAKGQEDYRKGLSGLLSSLEKQTTKRKAKERKQQDTAKYVGEMKQAHQLFLENSRSGKQRAAWTYTDGPDFFESPLLKIEQGESKICDRNQMLTGIFDVPDARFRPPHFEMDVHGGWNNFKCNLRNEELYEFKDKEWQKTPMSPGELKFKEKLQSSIERMTAESAQDALDKTTGYIRKQKNLDASGDHSCLKRIKPPFSEQRVTTHTFFHTHKPYKPGDHKFETGIQQYVEGSDRAMSYTRNVIAGRDQQKSFWNHPKESMSGTNRRQALSQSLLFHNKRGTGAEPSPPDLKRKVLLKGTGSLSFTCFKDALVEPTYARFSPMDISEPP